MQYFSQWFSELCTQWKGTAYFVPRREPFFLNPSNSRADIIHRLTGFTGSSAYILITAEKIFLYVDSRYTLQATKQSPECTVVECSDPLQVLPNYLPKGTRLMLSPWVWSVHSVETYKKAAAMHGWDIVFDCDHTLDRMFSQPVVSCNSIERIENPISFQEKCRSVFIQSDQNHWILMQAQDIAWLTNLRGSDHAYAPFFNAYLMVSKKDDHFSGILYTAMPRIVPALDQDIRVEDFKNLSWSAFSTYAHGSGGGISQQNIGINPSRLSNEFPVSSAISEQATPLILDTGARPNDDKRPMRFSESKGFVAVSVLENICSETICLKTNEQNINEKETKNDDKLGTMDCNEKDNTYRNTQANGEHEPFLVVQNPLDYPLVYDPKQTPAAVVRSHWIAGDFSALNRCKSIKNAWERHHMIQCHISDGVALTKFLYWLAQLSSTEKLQQETEWSAAQQLALFRAQNASYRGLSFPTISAMGPHSAIMHYTPSCSDNVPLTDGLYLVDSGGQYHFGTTDVTRTLWLGQQSKPSLALKQRYTQVLQGHIHLSQMIFPRGTNGMQLDAIARSFLWQTGLDYAHSTGHGVGCFANVHEFPPAIALRAPWDPIGEHMIFSIEPGYYEKDWGGIRLENLVLVRRYRHLSQDPYHKLDYCHDESSESYESLRCIDQSFTNCYEEDKYCGEPKNSEPCQKMNAESLLCLQPLTLAPFDLRLIVSNDLSHAHRTWLNQYHKKVYTTLLPWLNEQEQHWLKEQTQPL